MRALGYLLVGAAVYLIPVVVVLYVLTLVVHHAPC